MNSELPLVRAYLHGELSTKASGDREIEARWTVSKAQYYQTLKAVRALTQTPMRTIRIVDHTYGQSRDQEVRHRQIFEIRFDQPNVLVSPAKPSTEEWVQKRKSRRPYDSAEFGFRVDVATETKVPRPTGKPSGAERKNTRREILVTPAIRVDFPHDANPDRGESGYRVEVELLDATKIDDFLDWISRITCLIQESLLPVTRTERQQIINAYNELMTNGDTRYDSFQRATLPHPEDLEMHDLLRGTLLSRGRTSVSAKADGDTTELMFLETGIYAVSGRDQINKIARVRSADLIPAMFQGEMVVPLPKSGIKSSYTFVMFETLFYRGQDIRVQDQSPEVPTTLISRREYQKALVSAFAPGNNKSLTILSKEFPIATTTDDLYTATNLILDSLSKLPYKTDGLIETEVDRPYLNGEIDIKKSKSRENLTIDMRIGTGKLLVGGEGRGSNEIPFAGIANYPFTQPTPEEFRQIFDRTEFMEVGDVWEFRFDDQLRPHPVRPRYRKMTPNRLTTARNVWALVNRPVSEDTLRGRDLELMKRYHNEAKKGLFAKLKDGDTYGDFGSGKGGDLLKMKAKNLKVYLLEPDKNNRDELNRRIDENKFRCNVRGIVDFGAEETERVVKELLKGAQLDAVGMMLSWTFFNSSSEKMDAALETLDRSLRPGGTLIFATVDGDAMIEGLRGAAMLQTPQYTIERYQGREILIDIPGSIVQNQTEWLPDLVELDIRLRRRGFQLLEKRRLDQTSTLPKQQRILSAMYATLVYKKAVAELPPEEEEQQLEEEEQQLEEEEQQLEEEEEQQLMEGDEQQQLMEGEDHDTRLDEGEEEELEDEDGGINPAGLDRDL
jgi:SAM-dependent methyltransferase